MPGQSTPAPFEKERKKKTRRNTQIRLANPLHPGARSLTDTALSRLARRCPKLKKLILPGTHSLSDTSLFTLLSSCPDMTHLEITGSTMTHNAFATLQAHPTWAPKLKKLRLADHSGNAKFIKAMRELGRERPDLTIELVSTSQVKKWGDWELEVSCTTYKKGRKFVSRNPYSRGWNEDFVEYYAWD